MYVGWDARCEQVDALCKGCDGTVKVLEYQIYLYDSDVDICFYDIDGEDLMQFRRLAGHLPHKLHRVWRVSVNEYEKMRGEKGMDGRAWRGSSKRRTYSKTASSLGSLTTAWTSIGSSCTQGHGYTN